MYNYLKIRNKEVNIMYDYTLGNDELILIILYGARDEQCEGSAHFWEHMIVDAFETTYRKNLIDITATSDLDCIYLKVTFRLNTASEIMKGLLDIENLCFSSMNYTLNVELIRQEMAAHTHQPLFTIIAKAKEVLHLPSVLKKDICYINKFPSLQELLEEKKVLFSTTQTVICNKDNMELLSQYGTICKRDSNIKMCNSKLNKRLSLNKNWQMLISDDVSDSNEGIRYLVNIGVIEKKCLCHTWDVKLLLLLSLIWNRRLATLRKTEGSYFSFCYLNFHRLETEFVFLISKSNGDYYRLQYMMRLSLLERITDQELMDVEGHFKKIAHTEMSYKRKVAAFYTEQKILDNVVLENDHCERINELAILILNTLNEKFVIVR